MSCDWRMLSVVSPRGSARFRATRLRYPLGSNSGALAFSRSGIVGVSWLEAASIVCGALRMASERGLGCGSGIANGHTNCAGVICIRRLFGRMLWN